MHLKRLPAPKHYPIRRKEKKFTIAARPGPHAAGESMALGVVLRDALGAARTGAEVKKILASGGVLVDGKKCRDAKRAVGLMDAIELPAAKKAYRAVPKEGELTVNEIPLKNAKFKLCQVRVKKHMKGGGIQLGMHDGRAITVKAKDKDKYHTGDTLKIELPGQRIVKTIKMKEGNIAIITKGKHAGVHGRIAKVVILRKMKANRIRLETKDREVKTLKDYAFVIGEKKPEIKIPA